ncbi:MAG: autotransporter outer membrane beta-barrel domain-containing protein [Rhizobiaceae bacterium]
MWDLSNGDMFGGDPASISGPVPWFYNSTTKQFATFDPSGLAGTVNQLGDMTNLLSMVGRNGPGSGDGNGGSGEDITSNAWATTSPAADGLGYLWTAGFGSTMDHDGDLTTLDQETSLTGAAAGYRWQQAADLQFNVMAGYIQGEIKADSPYVRSQNIETDGWFAGVYGQQDLNGFTIDFGVVSGWLSSDSTRFVNDNLELTNGLTLGQSLALASYNSWFIAPEFGVAMDFDMEGVVYTPSARVRYSMQEIDGYAETGSNSNADVGARSIGVFEANVEMAATKRVNFGSLTGRAGYMFRNSNGDDAASISMLGITQSVGFGDSDASAAYLGVEADIEITPDMKLVIGGQGFFGEEVQGYQGMTRFVASF